MLPHWFDILMFVAVACLRSTRAIHCPFVVHTNHVTLVSHCSIFYIRLSHCH